MEVEHTSIQLGPVDSKRHRHRIDHLADHAEIRHAEVGHSCWCAGDGQRRMVLDRIEIEVGSRLDRTGLAVGNLPDCGRGWSSWVGIGCMGLTC